MRRRTPRKERGIKNKIKIKMRRTSKKENYSHDFHIRFGDEPVKVSPKRSYHAENSL